MLSATPEDIEELKTHFEYEYCDECGGDWYDHDIVALSLGAYGGPYPFYRCKSASNNRYKIRAREV